MDKILHPKEIEAATVKIATIGKTGTAFFVRAAENNTLLFTAEHNLPEADDSEILVTLASGQQSPASLLQRLPERDIAILKLNGPITEQLGLPIAETAIAYGACWESFGFPAERIQTGGRYDGKVSRINEGTKWDIDLECIQYSTLTDFSGLSGAPLIIDGLVVGVIGYDLAGTLGASSLAAAKAHISVEALSWFEQDDQSGIPRSISEEIDQAVANETVLDRIAAVIIELPDEHLFMINGNPGSGKTTLIAQLESPDEHHEICDRYFVKVPNHEEIPTQVRATPEFFMEWATGVYSRVLFDAPSEKKEQSWGDRLLGLRQGFQRLSDHYRSKNKTGLLLIDGLDDVSPNKLHDFLALLPESNCQHLKVVLSCTSALVVPADLRAKISEAAVIPVTPLETQKVLDYFTDVLASKSLTIEQRSLLADKSEGYPLYMRYLERYILSLPDDEELDHWIETVPRISGDISVYYKSVWGKLGDNAAEVWIAATIARLRQTVERETLYQMLNASEKNAFPVVFPKLQHLLKIGTEISIYHTSFSDFIKSKTTEISNDVHHGVAQYCQKNRKQQFATANIIYHLLNGNSDDRQAAVNTCDQLWADGCTIAGVTPDLILADIKNTVAMAAGFGLASEAIRLLLLSQRISFRYNTLFEENATYLVSALLACKKPAEALRYLIRNDKLTVSDGDAIFLLQRFLEYGFVNEGTELYELIKKTSHNMLENGLDGETFWQFADLRFGSLALATNLGQDYAHEYIELKKRTAHFLKANGNDATAVDQFKNRVSSYFQGYLAWRYGVPSSIKELEIKHPASVTNKSAGFMARCVSEFRKYERQSVRLGDLTKLKTWGKDIEYAIEKYGSVPADDQKIIAALVFYGENIKLVESLINRCYGTRPIINIRQDNGVDLDPDQIHNFYQYAQSMGYIDQTDAYPKLLPLRYGQWEESLKRQLEYVFFLTGKICRYMADGQAAKLIELKPRISALIRNFEIQLIDRQHWGRAYALPENLLPLIWGQLLELLVRYFPEEVDSFLIPVVERKNYQLGLYSEGYMDLLFHLIGVIDKLTVHWPRVYKLAKILESHIVTGVENRFEKNEYLLRLVEIYARLGNMDEANRCFRIMLDHSMGPGWYKESQLSVMNTTVRSALPEDHGHYLQQYAAHLHHASGEMTFQRYIKQGQEDFVGDLANAGHLSAAIAYFKYLVMPDYQTVLENAESSPIDMPVKGQGYILGARAIEEQAGILRLLEKIDCSGSLAAWGLCELWFFGDDRYMRDYATIQAAILKQSDPSGLIDRAAKFLVTEVDPEFRPEYIAALLDRTTAETIPALEAGLKKAGLRLPKKEKNDDRPRKHDRIDPLDSLIEAKDKALTLLDMGNRSGAAKLLISALSDIQSKKYSVWSDYYSDKINSVTRLFTQVYDQSSVFVTDIKELLVNEPYFEAWVVAERLIKLIGPIANDAEKAAIAQAVDQHIAYLVRTPEHTITRYQWLADQSIKGGAIEEQLLDLLIWFLNHPDLTVKNRTTEILAWSCTQSPKTVVPALVRSLFQPGYQLSNELAAAVLHQVATKDMVEFWPALADAFAAYEPQWPAISHFSIINILIEIFEMRSLMFKDQLTVLYAKFATELASHEEVYFEEEYLEPINDYLDALAAAGISNGKFAKSLTDLINNWFPITIEESQRASQYIERSFNDFYGLQIIPDFETFLRFCLNKTVTGFVTADIRKTVADILRFYQPIFPENKLQINSNRWRGLDDQIRKVAIGEMSDVRSLIGQDVLLHYFSEQYDKDNRESSSYECTCYLVPLADWTENYRFQPRCEFPANMLPDDQFYQNEDNCIPLTAESYSVETIGSDLTPSCPVRYAPEHPYAFIADLIQTAYWRDGRNWDQQRRGEPINTGYCLHIPKHKLNKLKAAYKLIMILSYDYHYAHIDVFAQKLIKYENPE